MSSRGERRSCIRFEVPDAVVHFVRSRLFLWKASLSEERPVVNVSKGGLAFISPVKLRKYKKIVLDLNVPDEPIVRVRGQVRWQSQWDCYPNYLTGIQFAPYGKRRGWNAVEILTFFERLEDRYHNQPFRLPEEPLFAKREPAPPLDLNKII